MKNYSYVFDITFSEIGQCMQDYNIFDGIIKIYKAVHLSIPSTCNNTISGVPVCFTDFIENFVKSSGALFSEMAEIWNKSMPCLNLMGKNILKKINFVTSGCQIPKSS